MWVSLHWLVTMSPLNESDEIGQQKFGAWEKIPLADGLKWTAQKNFVQQSFFFLEDEVDREGVDQHFLGVKSINEMYLI